MGWLTSPHIEAMEPWRLGGGPVRLAWRRLPPHLSKRRSPGSTNGTFHRVSSQAGQRLTGSAAQCERLPCVNRREGEIPRNLAAMYRIAVFRSRSCTWLPSRARPRGQPLHHKPTLIIGKKTAPTTGATSSILKPVVPGTWHSSGGIRLCTCTPLAVWPEE